MTATSIVRRINGETLGRWSLRLDAAALVPEVRRERVRRGYHVGSRVLDAVLPEHVGPTAHVFVDSGDTDEGSIGGIESRSAILASLRAGLEALCREDSDRVLTCCRRQSMPGA